MRPLHSVVQTSLLLHPLRASASDASGIVIIIIIIEMTAYTRTAAHHRPPRCRSAAMRHTRYCWHAINLIQRSADRCRRHSRRLLFSERGAAAVVGRSSAKSKSSHAARSRHRSLISIPSRRRSVSRRNALSLRSSMTGEHAIDAGGLGRGDGGGRGEEYGDVQRVRSIERGKTMPDNQ